MRRIVVKRKLFRVIEMIKKKKERKKKRKKKYLLLMKDSVKFHTVCLNARIQKYLLLMKDSYAGS